jgi:hypothetical protein
VGILLLVSLALGLVAATYGLILIPAGAVVALVLYLRHKQKLASMAVEVERLAREGRQLESLLSGRVVNLLATYGISTETQLRRCSDDDLIKLPGFGSKSLTEVRAALRLPPPPPS